MENVTVTVVSLGKYVYGMSFWASGVTLLPHYYYYYYYITDPVGLGIIFTTTDGINAPEYISLFHKSEFV